MSSAGAQSWPAKAVKIIVPVAAGTATDITARIFGEKLAAKWGQPVIIENRPGADGLVAIGSFVSQRDPHTLLFSFSTAVSLNPLIHPKLSYDPDADLVPITTTAEVVLAIAVNNATGVKAVAQLVEQIQKEPGKYNWAAAPGLPRYVFEAFRAAAKLDMVYVPYNQTGTAAQDLGAGRIQVMIAAVSTLLPIVQAGQTRFLAVTSNDRAKMVPDVLSATEAGYPSLMIPALGCVFGGRDMPAGVRDQIARDVDAVAADNGVVERLAQAGQTVRRSTPAGLSRLLAEQRTALAPIAAALGPAQ